MAADRAQHVHEVVEPALAAGRHVVTDRFAGSSIAYQGYARGLDPDEVRRLSEWATDGVWPDLVVLLDVTRSIASTRLGSRPRSLRAGGRRLPRAGGRRLPRPGRGRSRPLGRRRRVRQCGRGGRAPCAPRSPSGYNSGHDRDRPRISTRRPRRPVGDRRRARTGRSPSCRPRPRRRCTPTCWSGPRGSGKRALALAFAAELLSQRTRGRADADRHRRLALAERAPRSW